MCDHLRYVGRVCVFVDKKTPHQRRTDHSKHAADERAGWHFFSGDFALFFELFDALSSRHPSVNHELVLRNKAHRIAMWDSFPQAAARRELAGAVEMLLAAVAADDAHLKGIRGSGCYFGDLYSLGGH